METLAKSRIVQKLVWAINHSEQISETWILKGTNKVVSVTMVFAEQEVFVDKNGVEWVRK